MTVQTSVMLVMAKSCGEWTQTVRAATRNQDLAHHNLVEPCMQGILLARRAEIACQKTLTW